MSRYAQILHGEIFREKMDVIEVSWSLLGVIVIGGTNFLWANFNDHVVQGSPEKGHFPLKLCISSDFVLNEQTGETNTAFLPEDWFRSGVPSSGNEATVFHVSEGKPGTNGGNYLKLIRKFG